MKRLLLVVSLVLSGCAGAAGDVRGGDAPGGPQGRMEEGPQHDHAVNPDRYVPADAIHARVIESVIQRDRVVVTLDAGSSDGVRAGMKGVMGNGRPMKVIATDFHTCRVVVVGLNLRFAPGSDATIFR